MKCFISLYDICATCGVLPKQYTLDHNELTSPGGGPVDGGGSGSVWKGEYRGMAVAIKKLNVTQQNIPEKVCHLIEIECSGI